MTMTSRQVDTELSDMRARLARLREEIENDPTLAADVARAGAVRPMHESSRQRVRESDEQRFVRRLRESAQADPPMVRELAILRESGAIRNWGEFTNKFMACTPTERREVTYRICEAAIPLLQEDSLLPCREFAGGGYRETLDLAEMLIRAGAGERMRALAEDSTTTDDDLPSYTSGPPPNMADDLGISRPTIEGDACPECDGTGLVRGLLCDACQGSGSVVDESDGDGNPNRIDGNARARRRGEQDRASVSNTGYQAPDRDDLSASVLSNTGGASSLSESELLLRLEMGDPLAMAEAMSRSRPSAQRARSILRESGIPQG